MVPGEICKDYRYIIKITGYRQIYMFAGAWEVEKVSRN